MHVDRFSDKKTNDFTRDSLSQVITFNGFPHELVQGMNNGMDCQWFYFTRKTHCFFIMHLRFMLANNINLNWCFQANPSECQEEKSFDGTQSQV